MADTEFALQVTIVGFTMVLFTLFVLYLILLLFGKIFPDNKEISIASVENSLLVNLHDDDLISSKKKAAISAALSIIMEEGSDFKITCIESEITQNKWLLEGRKKLHGMNAEIDKIRREKDGKKIF